MKGYSVFLQSSLVCKSICAFTLLGVYGPLCHPSVNMELGRLHFFAAITGVLLSLLLPPLLFLLLCSFGNQSVAVSRRSI